MAPSLVLVTWASTSMMPPIFTVVSPIVKPSVFFSGAGLAAGAGLAPVVAVVLFFGAVFAIGLVPGGGRSAAHGGGYSRLANDD